MRLLTHNLLACNVKGVRNGFPLKIDPVKVESKEVDFNPDFLQHVYSKLDWRAFCEAAAILGVSGLPPAVTDASFEDEGFMKLFHHALLEVHLEEGTLECPESGRRFPVSKGIPNMLLHEDEC